MIKFIWFIVVAGFVLSAFGRAVQTKEGWMMIAALIAVIGIIVAAEKK